MSECDSYTDYHDYRIERAVILGFPPIHETSFPKCVNMPPILRERLIWQRMTRNTNTVKITAWGAVCIWNATSIAVGRFQKERIYDLEKFIERYTHTAGDEANIYLKAPLKESAAKQPTTFADLSTLNLETVEYSEKVIGVFGDTKLIKDVLKGLNDLFSVRTSSTTVKGVRDGYTAGSRKYVRHSQCMPTHRDEKAGRFVPPYLSKLIQSISTH